MAHRLTFRWCGLTAFIRRRIHSKYRLVPQEDGVDRFRDKEGKETSLPILPSVSHGVTVKKYDISTLRHEGILIDNDNDPVPENVLHSEDVWPAPKTLNLRFQGIISWHHNRNFPVGKENIKMVSRIRVQHM